MLCKISSLGKLVFIALFICCALPAPGQHLRVEPELKHDVSPPLRELVKAAQTSPSTQQEAEEVRPIPLPPGFKPASEPDLALQRTTAAAPAELGPTLGLNFEGLGSGFPDFFVNVAPPDPNGAVGLTQYVQWVNLSFAVFDKATGNVLPNFPTPGNTLWIGFGNGCETNNDGDPIVTYDKLADRWIFTQLEVSTTPFLQCVAVSTAPDATGTYNRYSFTYSNFNDYPKLAVWPDAYYITFNLFSGNTFLGADACAYDRNAMLNGLTASQVCFPQASTSGSLLPADVDGRVPPPAGEPNFVLGFDVNSLTLYKFHVDFATPANSTFTGPTAIPVSPFTPVPFDCNGVRGCVPQGNTPTTLDALGDRLMYRLAYRNFGDHESLVVNHSVVADTVNLNTGVRWYEIQNPNGTPTVAQQSTFAPDSNYRWMGSIAMDVSGDMALGYSVSSATASPSIAFTGRIASGPAGTLQTETPLSLPSTASQEGLVRWGDYSAMQVDPVDDCTFWYTAEYLQFAGAFNWNTRIANFKYPSCGVPDLTIVKSHSGNFTQGLTGTYTLTVSNIGGKDSDGSSPVTVTDTLPTGLTATAITGTNWSCTPGTLTCTRRDVLAKGSSYEPIKVTVNVADTAPGVVMNTANVSGGGDRNPTNNTASDATTIIQTGPDPAISKTHTDPFVQGQTGTYTITVTNTGLTTTSGTVTVTDNLPAGLTASTVAGMGWNCVLGPPVSCNRNDALPSNTSYSPITLTVNVAANASGRLVNSVTVSGGGDVNTLNNTANDVTNVIPPPPDLTITKSHSGNFNQGQSNAVYTLTVSNVAGSGSTVGFVTVQDTLPTGLTAARMVGFGWFCNVNTVTCTRSDVLAGGASYPPINLFVNVANNAPGSVVNTATVSGGHDVTPGNDTANDPTIINPSPDLTIAKSHTPTTFTVGQTGTYNITVSNVGTVATSGVVSVTDVLPTGMSATAFSATGWSCDGVFVVFCSRSDALAVGASYPTIAITVNVATPQAVSETNTASVRGGGEFNTANDTANDTTAINAPALTITKTHSPDPLTVGQNGSYSITVGNAGTAATVGTVTVTDALPSSMTATAITGAGWSCSSVPTAVVKCTRSDSLATNNSYPPLIVTVNLGNQPPSIVNTATVSGGGAPSSQSASDTASVIGPVVMIAKSHTGNFTVGQTGTYTITVSNIGKVATAGTIAVQDLVPSVMTAIATGGTGWGCSSVPTNILNCTRSDSLAAGNSYPALTVIVSVSSAAGTSTLNQATVSGGGDATSRSVDDVTNINAPILAITKSHTGNFTVGLPGTYTINVSNTGNLPTSGTVTLQDALPAGLTATAVTGAGWSCSPLPMPTALLTCTRSDPLAVNASYPALMVTVSVTGGGPSVINTATVTGGGDSIVHSANDSTNINAPVLAITKTHTADPFIVGQTGTYTINVSNTGTASTFGVVTVQDPLPSGLAATAAAGTGWSCSGTSPVTCTRSDSLAPGNSYPPISVTVAVNAAVPAGVATNTASVTGGGDFAVHSASDVTNINAPVLAITKTHTPDPFIVGQTGTYTINVTNTGKASTFGTVTVQDNLLLGMTAISTTGTGWSCSALPAASLTCTRSDPLPAGTAYPSLVLTVSVDALKVVRGRALPLNEAIVSGGGDLSSHFVIDQTHVVAPVLAITASHSPEPFSAGQTATYTVGVSNVGTLATVGTVTVTDLLPPPLTFSPSTSGGSGWSCTGPQPVMCTRSDSLAAGGNYPTLTIGVNVNNPFTSAITNRVGVTGGGDGASRSATDVASVLVPDLAITETHSPDPLVVGQTGTYTITVANNGNIPTTGTPVTVQDSLPSGLTAIAITGSGWSCPALPATVLTCTRSDTLAINTTYPPIAVTVSVSGGSPAVTNTASVTGGGDGVTHTVNDLINISAPALAIAESHSAGFAVGQTGTYTISVSNAGSLPTAGTVSVADSLPAGLTATVVSASGWSCNALPNTVLNCSRSDALAAGGSYSPITVTVSIDSTAAPTVVNSSLVSGGGDSNSHSVADPTSILLPDLAISKTHTGNFFAGEIGAAYTITVSNTGTVATAGGTLTVDDLMPAGLTATSAVGAGWNCFVLPGLQTEMSCTRTADVLAPGGSYPPIALNVNVAFDAPASLSSTVSVMGIGDANFANNFASDPTIIAPLGVVPASPTSVTVTAGSSASYIFTIDLSTSQPPGTITFSASQLPPNTKVTFNPASLSLTGTVTMTIDTSGNGHVAAIMPSRGSGMLALIAAAVVPLFVLLAGKSKRKLIRTWLCAAMCICGLAALLSFSGCGGGSSNPPPTPTPTPIPTPTPTPIPTPTPTPTPGPTPSPTPTPLPTPSPTPTPLPTPSPTPTPTTPPGTYTITFTATGAGATASTSVQLVVQ
jgi:uncharacterized repeat protein (TIGR01451 family)